MWAVTPVAVAAGKAAIDYVNVQVALGMLKAGEVASVVGTATYKTAQKVNTFVYTHPELIRNVGDIVSGAFNPSLPANMYQSIGFLLKFDYDEYQDLKR